MTDSMMPRGAALVVTVNLDGEHHLLGRDPRIEGQEKTLSTARYGLRRGVDAVIEALDDARVPATWFAPGALARTHPEVVARVAERDEIGMRGDIVAPLRGSESDRARSLDAAVDAFARIDVRPRVFRLPAGEWQRGLAGQLLDRGVEASSSFTHSDLPLRLPADDGRELIDVPYHYVNEDRQAFEWNFSPAVPAGHSRISSYGEVLTNWVWELEGAVAERVLFVLSISPDVIGTPGRIGLLHELLAHARGLDDVRFATVSDVADAWRATGAASPVQDSLSVFGREPGGTSL